MGGTQGPDTPKVVGFQDCGGGRSRTRCGQDTTTSGARGGLTFSVSRLTVAGSLAKYVGGALGAKIGVGFHICKGVLPSILRVGQGARGARGARRCWIYALFVEACCPEFCVGGTKEPGGLG